MYSDKDHLNDSDNHDKFNVFNKYIDDIIQYRIKKIENISKLRFQRLLYSSEWRNLKNINVDYNESDEILYYWIDIVLYDNDKLDLMRNDNGYVDNINFNEFNSEEIEYERKVKNIINYYCFEEYCGYIDINNGFVPLIRGQNGQNILNIIKKCKNDLLKKKNQRNNSVIMPQKRENVFKYKQNEEYILDTFMRNNNDNNKASTNRIWIFSNNYELLRLLKLNIFNICRNGEIFKLNEIFKDINNNNSQKFYIKQGMLNTKTNAKVYSNGDELFIIGDEKQRLLAKNWIAKQLQQWKIQYIGSKEQELSKISDKQEFEEMTQSKKLQISSDMNDATLLNHF